MMEWHESSPLETAQRELVEETGISASEVELRDTGIWSQFPLPASIRSLYPAGTTYNREYLVSCRIDSPVGVELCQSEHTNSCWVSGENAMIMVWSWTNRLGFRYLINDSVCSGSVSD